jgi:hypothetical protein
LIAKLKAVVKWKKRKGDAAIPSTSQVTPSAEVFGDNSAYRSDPGAVPGGEWHATRLCLMVMCEKSVRSEYYE